MYSVCQKSDTLLVFEFLTLDRCIINVMVSVGVSHMGKTGVIFIELGAKVSSSYYCSVNVFLLKDCNLLPDIRAKCRQYRWTLQQDGAPPHILRKHAWVVQQQGRHIEHITVNQ